MCGVPEEVGCSSVASSPGNDDKKLARDILHSLWSKLAALDTLTMDTAHVLASYKPDAITKQLVAEALSRLWSKILTACNAAVEAAHDVEGTNLLGVGIASGRDVVWMVSGEVACSLPVNSTSCVSEMESAVREQTGVPEREQRLFFDGKALTLDTTLSAATPTLPLMLVRTVSDPRVTDLSHFHIPAQFEEVPAGGLTHVRKLCQGINGDIFKYRCRRSHLKGLACEATASQMSGDVEVAVKKIRTSCFKFYGKRETNERAVHLEPWKNAPPEEDALTEIGVLTYLSQQCDLPKYLIRMLGCFSEARHTWLITEFADGGELFDLVASSCLGEHKVQRYSWELLQAVEYLHSHRIGHRDISLENTLIKGDTVKLMDFGLAVQSHSASGTPLRYFRAAGKNFYRAPECYVPASDEVRVIAPLSSKPGDIVMVDAGGYLCEVRLPLNSVAGEACKAAVWGYTAMPVDIFAAGMAICILCCGFPIWQRALLADSTFAYVHNLGNKGLPMLLQRWQKPLPPAGAVELLTSMLQTAAPSNRPSASDCLASTWFSSLNEPQSHQAFDIAGLEAG